MATIAALWWVWLILVGVCGILIIPAIAFGVISFDDYKEGWGVVGCGGAMVFLLITLASLALFALSIVLNVIDYAATVS